jgi:catechol 2,3-dioxygenase-like lactoylglutathione lyase family enzyme
VSPGEKETKQMAVVNANRLSHVALKTRDIEGQVRFYEEMVGLKETGRDDRGRAYLRCGDRHHALILVPLEGASDTLDHFALEAADGDAGVEATASALSKAGIAYEEKNDVPGQGRSLRLCDPNGFSIELFGSMEKVSPNYGPRVVQPLQQDHLNFKVRDPEGTAEFYKEVLGFEVSDRLSDGSIVWMRCNPRHHSVAFIRDEEKTALHHLGFEVADSAQLVHQAEHLMRNGRTLVWGPGRHGPGNNQFVYFRDLDRNIIEFACDMRLIWDQDYEPRSWDPGELWADLWGSLPPTEWLEHPEPEERPTSVSTRTTILEQAI